MIGQHVTAAPTELAHPQWCRSHVAAWETVVDICHRSEPEVIVSGDDQIVTVTHVRFDSLGDEWQAGEEGYELEVGEELTFLPLALAKRVGLVLLGVEEAGRGE